MDDVKFSACRGAKVLEFEQGQRRVPCVTCSGSGVDWRKTCEGVQQEAEVLRYDLQVAHSVINAHKPELDAQRLRADTAEAQTKLANRELEIAAEQLVAAEQRIAELTELLGELDENWNSHDGRERFSLAMRKVEAALNPKPEAGSHE